MKTLGLIGGTTWLSTIDYYKYLNEMVNERTGGKDYAKCIIYSFNFRVIKDYADTGAWDKILELAASACSSLKQAGAEAIVLCANTMHYIAEGLKKKINLPLISIVEATANEISKRNLKKVLLLGTKFSMEFDFYKTKLAEHGIETIVPGENDRNFIHNSIFDELGNNILKPETKERYISIINGLVKQGVEGVILGCTEIPLLIKNNDLNIPVFDTTLIHSRAAVDFALS